MTPGSEADTVQAQAAVVAQEFQTSAGVDFADPWVVRERCAEVSEAFARVCQEAGLPARVVSGGEFGEMPQFPGVRMLFNGHYATLIEDGADGLVYDWTARQFTPDCPVPWVCTLAEWRTRWEPLA